VFHVCLLVRLSLGTRRERFNRSPTQKKNLDSGFRRNDENGRRLC